MAHVLIVDDDPQLCDFLSQMVETLGHETTVCHTLEEGCRVSLSRSCDVVLLDLEFPDGNGLQILPDVLKAPSRPEVIIVTGTGDKRGAELAYKYGAWDFVQKPFRWHEVSLPITRAIQYRKEREGSKRPVPLKRDDIIGHSAEIESCLGLVARAAATEAGVLLTGETGTGKELFARAIHENSSRSTMAFVPVDCGALPENLVESILFGHERGAFTGAEVARQGLFLQASGGTLFLDEIGELSHSAQRSLLRSLQEKKIRPLGARREVPVDFRLVAATNRDLEEMVADGAFREDLLFRIRTLEIRLPPLRERGQDTKEIALSKIRQLSRYYDMGVKGVSPEFLELLGAHAWPGNVRELINVMEYALAASGPDPTLFPKHLPPEYRTTPLKTLTEMRANAASSVVDPSLEGAMPTLSEFRDQHEKQYLQMLLARSHGDRRTACRLSGISQSRLYTLLKKHGLSTFGG